MALTITYMEGFDLDILPPGMTTAPDAQAGTQDFGPGRVGRAMGLRGSADGRFFGMAQLLPAPQATGAVAFAYGVSPYPNQPYFFAVREGATIHLQLKRLEDNTCVLQRGDGTQIGVASPVLSWAGWNHFELSYVIHDTAGAVTLYCNSQKIIDLSNIDTRNGGTVGTVDRVSWHKSSAFIDMPISYIDDVVIGSTRDRIGDCKIETLIPNGNGDPATSVALLDDMTSGLPGYEGSWDRLDGDGGYGTGANGALPHPSRWLRRITGGTGKFLAANNPTLAGKTIASVSFWWAGNGAGATAKFTLAGGAEKARLAAVASGDGPYVKVTVPVNAVNPEFWWTQEAGVVFITLLEVRTADGTLIWVGSDGNSVDNWDMVNDTSAADYVQSKVPGARDMYTLTDPNAIYGDVLAVQVQAQVFKSADGAPVGDLKAVLRDSVSGTEVKDTLISNAVLSTSPQWVMGPVRQADPTGGTWDLTKLTNLQAGVELVAS